MKRFLSLLLTVILALSLSANAFAANNGFTDVPADADYAAAVDWCFENGLISGIAADRFDPNGTLTRAMVASILYRAAGEPAITENPAFTDTQAGAWYTDAVAWASSEGVFHGYGNNLFGTNDPVTKEQLDVVLRRYNGDNPDWKGDPLLAVAATRAEAATAFYHALAPKTQDNKVLVVYYSATGSTKNVAGYIADKLDADLFELIPTEPYSDADLNWTVDGSRVNREHDDESLRNIELTNSTPDNWDDYDTVFIGYPIWWSIAAWPVNSFITANDFTGKTVIPFCTSASSDLGQSGTQLAEMAGTGDWQSGQRFSSGASRAAVEQWIDELK